MNLDLKDRIILHNQYLLLSHFYPDEKDYYLRIAKVLEQGYEAEYKDLSFSFSETFPRSQSSFVIDVLAMYTEFAWAKQKGTEIPKEDAFLFEFSGFDGNNESPYLGYAKFQIEQEGRWDLLKGKSLNSHCPTLETYRKMLTAWKESAVPNELTTDDFVRIAASVRASSR